MDNCAKMNGKGPSVLWFRHGLRLHDNPALLSALELAKTGGGGFLAVFIFDGESAGTKLVGYNRMKFLLESLADLDRQLRRAGGQLYIFSGAPAFIFRRLWEEICISSICWEQDCEPIWRDRDEAVVRLCNELDISYNEKISHTLWNPREIIETNGGIPPLTYQMFLHIVNCIGQPPRPESDPDFREISFVKLPSYIREELGTPNKNLEPSDFGITRESSHPTHLTWTGGESEALKGLKRRLVIEGFAFSRGDYMPNQMCPDLIGANSSLSAALRFGCLSVRKFYYAIHDRFSEVQSSSLAIPNFVGGPHITGQLFWREYFYTMSVDNRFYDRMMGNPICLNIPWSPVDAEQFDKWKNGQTGFPLIDAAMRQLISEGWLHHTLRNAVATFLTRGGLWFSWEHGLQFFLKYLLDADWSVCAGNWMWISSSAFEKLLDSSKCTCPIALARRLDPKGEYLLRYLPELRRLPQKYIHQPWLTPRPVQEEVNCVIGIHYPEPMIDLAQANERNSRAMREIRNSVVAAGKEVTGADQQNPQPAHCRPSNDEEICKFFWLSDESAASQVVINVN